MLVVASNEPEQFDWAVNDRLDEMLQFNLATLDERLRITYLYFIITRTSPINSNENNLRIWIIMFIYFVLFRLFFENKMWKINEIHW